jgi:hypothetical protein
MKKRLEKRYVYSLPFLTHPMKKLFLTLAMLSLLAGLPFSHAFAQRGHYKGGKGSSHKEGSYKNKATNDHYRKRK